MFVENQIIAHRGASAYAPENTLAAFQQAHSMGAQWVEFDVMLSKDGEAFVFHDETLKRTTNGKGKLGHVTSDYLKSLDAGSWFSSQYKHEKIPTLKDTLLWHSQNDIKVNLEIKPFPGFTQETTLATLQALNLYWPEHKGRLLVSSFDIEALRLCRSLEPELPLSILLDKWQDDSIVCATELNCVSVNLNRRIVTSERVSQLKNAGFKVCVYTINRKRDALRFFNWGVDAIFSNYPDLLQRSLKQKFFKKFLDKSRRVA